MLFIKAQKLMLSCFIKRDDIPTKLIYNFTWLKKSKLTKTVYVLSRQFLHSLQDTFQQNFPVVCLTSVWWIRYDLILINAAVYINQVTACSSLALHIKHIFGFQARCCMSLFSDILMDALSLIIHLNIQAYYCKPTY